MTTVIAVEATLSPDRYHASFDLDKSAVPAGTNLTYTGICLYLAGIPADNAQIYLQPADDGPQGQTNLVGNHVPDPTGHGEFVITLPIPRYAPPGHYFANMSCLYDDVVFDENQQIPVEVTPAEGPDPNLTAVNLPDSG